MHWSLRLYPHTPALSISNPPQNIPERFINGQGLTGGGVHDCVMRQQVNDPRGEWLESVEAARKVLQEPHEHFHAAKIKRFG